MKLLTRVRLYGEGDTASYKYLTVNLNDTGNVNYPLRGGVERSLYVFDLTFTVTTGNISTEKDITQYAIDNVDSDGTNTYLMNSFGFKIKSYSTTQFKVNLFVYDYNAAVYKVLQTYGPYNYNDWKFLRMFVFTAYHWTGTPPNLNFYKDYGARLIFADDQYFNTVHYDSGDINWSTFAGSNNITYQYLGLYFREYKYNVAASEKLSYHVGPASRYCQSYNGTTLNLAYFPRTDPITWTSSQYGDIKFYEVISGSVINYSPLDIYKLDYASELDELRQELLLREQEIADLSSQLDAAKSELKGTSNKSLTDVFNSLLTVGDITGINWSLIMTPIINAIDWDLLISPIITSVLEGLSWTTVLASVITAIIEAMPDVSQILTMVTLVDDLIKGNDSVTFNSLINYFGGLVRTILNTKSLDKNWIGPVITIILNFLSKIQVEFYT